MTQTIQNDQDKINNKKQQPLDEYPKGNLLSTTVIKCSQVSVENDSWTVSKFGLQTINTGIELYKSGNYSRWQTWTLDLTPLNLAPGAQYYVKAMVVGDDSLSNVIIEYTPTANATAFFKLTGKATETSLTYIALV